MEFLAKFDCFPKANNDFRLKTNYGGLVSLLTVFIMVILLISELTFHLKLDVVDHFYVNTTRAEKLTVMFDLSFPQIPCNLLSIDAIDETGAPQTDAIHNIYKYRLSPTGEKIGIAEKHEIGGTLTTEKQIEEITKELSKDLPPEVKCGNCYGASPPGECCNTCEEVRLAYQRVGWKFIPQGIAQCQSIAALKSLKDQFASDGGCRIFGDLQLSRASGHFHIAPHKKLHEEGLQSGLINLLDLISFTFDQFNVTHTVNTLNFGHQFPGVDSPLDGHSIQLEDTHGMYQYYVKVVPTLYKEFRGRVIESNQYSVTEHMRHLAPGSGRGVPGVYFYYEISPIQAVFEEKRKSLWRILTSMCALLGGAYTVMGLIDKILGLIFSQSKTL